MKTTTQGKHARAGIKAARKPVRRKTKKTFDLSWLLDRPLPPQSEATENYVIVMRNRP